MTKTIERPLYLSEEQVAEAVLGPGRRRLEMSTMAVAP
jgi:hypothetical protein